MSHSLVFLALGSNLGDRTAALASALEALAATPGIRVVQATDPIVTSPLGGLDQPDYLNGMALLSVELTPHELLGVCQAIERAAGRVDREPWASRELDLDILLFGDLVSDDPMLQLPHPGLLDRQFWQEQLAELMAVHDG